MVEYTVNRTHIFSDEMLNFVRLSLMTEDMARCYVDRTGYKRLMSVKPGQQPTVNPGSCVLNNLNKYGHVSLYNEVSTLLETFYMLENILQSKTSRQDDEELLEETKQLLDGSGSSSSQVSEYTPDQLFNRMNALITAIDEKLIL